MRPSPVASVLSTLLLVSPSVLHTSAADIDIVLERRLSVIVGSSTGAASIPTWISTLGPDGRWPDVDYTTGCDAQESGWPAQSHWSRINSFSAGWHGGFPHADQWVKNAEIREAISRAMNFWFSNDFTNPACLDSGGEDPCPCGTPGLWNKNWFSNIILIPGWVGQVCTLLGDSLLADELDSCVRITGRAFNTFSTGINHLSAGITGANALDIAGVGVDLALFTGNSTLLSEAFSRVNAEVVIQNAVKADGIRADGSFGQHAGLLYNGNYGKNYVVDVLALEIATGGTEFGASADSMDAFSTLIEGNQWMIFQNTLTKVLHWDFSVLGRIISLPVVDNQPTASLKINITQIQVLGQLWDSPTITSAFNALHSPGSTVNAARLHFAAWDWNLIPGTTVDYDATPLSCSTIRKTGTQALVGGASDDTVGVAAMRYETPTTKTLNWRKTWFFLEDDVQFVMIAKLNSTTTAPVFSVLDQKRRSGDVLVDGVNRDSGNYTGVGTLWHAGVGYVFNASNPSVSLSLQLGPRTGSWSSISSSKAPPTTVDLFAAWLSHNDLSSPISYTIYPATSTPSAFEEKVAATHLRSVRNDGSISALLDVNHNTVMIVYWTAAGGSVSIPSPTGNAPITIASNGNANLILHMESWSITLSDPTQTLSTVTVTLTLRSGTAPAGWGTAKTKSVTFSLPSGGLAGKSVTQTLPN